jgi:hypothetical protein
MYRERWWYSNLDRHSSNLEQKVVGFEPGWSNRTRRNFSILWTRNCQCVALEKKSVLWMTTFLQLGALAFKKPLPITIKKEKTEHVDGGRQRLGAATKRALARIRQDQGDDEGAAATAEDGDEDIEAAAERPRRLSAEAEALPEVADLLE